MQMKRALITGVTGQDGSYLAESLLEKGYQVFGLVRRTSSDSFERIKHICDQITLESADLLDEASIMNLVKRIQPQELYNLAAQAFVPASFDQPVFTGEVTGLGVTRILDAIRIVDPTIRFYQASSSQMFGALCLAEHCRLLENAQQPSPTHIETIRQELGRVLSFFTSDDQTSLAA